MRYQFSQHNKNRAAVGFSELFREVRYSVIFYGTSWIFFVDILKATEEKSRTRIRNSAVGIPGSVSVSKSYGSVTLTTYQYLSNASKMARY
jgi:hypothetical protein